MGVCSGGVVGVAGVRSVIDSLCGRGGGVRLYFRGVRGCYGRAVGLYICNRTRIRYMKSYLDLVASARERVREVTPDEVRGQQPGVVIIDVREQNEWNLGHVPGALYIGRGVLESAIEERVPREASIVLYCASGNRSILAAVVLQEMGYTEVASMIGGMRGWVDSGGGVED